MAATSLIPFSSLFKSTSRTTPPPSKFSQMASKCIKTEVDPRLCHPSIIPALMTRRHRGRRLICVLSNQNLDETNYLSRTRRQLFNGLALIPFVRLLSAPPPPVSAREVEVGSYLPPSPNNPSFVVFQASPKDTPALRAGNVQPYKFIIPPTWKQTRIANILSGNYCQPKCAEPWIEVKFEDERQGRIQVVVSPLIRLTNKPNATIEDIGSPDKVIASLGPFVTGNTYDPDELLETSVEKHGDQTYYKYVLETPYASTGSHNLAKATAKGGTVVLFVASANDKQWQASQKTLQAILDSFEV